MEGDVYSIYYSLCVKSCKTYENRKRIEALKQNYKSNLNKNIV